MDFRPQCVRAVPVAHHGWCLDLSSRGTFVFVVATHLLLAASILSVSQALCDPVMNGLDFRVDARVRIYAQRVSSAGAVDPNWSPDPSRLSAGAGHEYAFASIPNGSNATVVAWVEATRSGSGVRATRLEVDGTISSGWPVGGVSLSGAAGYRYGVKATSDGAGGALFTWQDLRSARPRVFAQRVTSSGAIASGWPQDGLAIGGSSADQEVPAIVSDSSGGAFVAWQERQGAIFQVRVLRITSAGAVSSGWPSTGIVPCPSSNQQIAPVVTSDEVGGLLIVWESVVQGESKLIAARVTAAGTLSSGWPSSGLALATATGQQRRAVLASDGHAGGLVGWWDTRAGGGDIYAQAFTSGGAIAAGWPAAGAAACTQGSEQLAPALLGSGSDLFLAWEDFRGGSTDVYAQRMTAGAPASGWPANGVALTTDGGEQYAPRLMNDGSGGAIATWFDTRSISGSPVSVPGPSREPQIFALFGPWPSPAVRGLRVAFALPDGAPAKLELLDIAGRRIASREVGSLGAGRHLVGFERTHIPAGIYVIRLTRGGRSLTTTASVLR